jgi:photosystem II stability/assembly factor-like uncharacterized protein
MQRSWLLLTAVLCGCSGSGSGGAAPHDSGPSDTSAADVEQGADAPATTDDGGQGTQPDSAGAQDASHGGDSGTVPYAPACADGGRVPVTPTGSWTSASGNLAGLGSECGNMSNLSSKPDEDMLIAGIAQRGLWASKNGGTSWTQLGQGAGSATITNRTSSILYDPAHPQTFWESGIYNAGGVYKTTDDGTTLSRLGTVTHNDSVSVDFTDPQRQTLLAGTHEQSGHLYRSTDGGNTWTDIGPKLPAGTGFSSQALVIDSQIHLVGTYSYSNSGTGLGVFRTTDGGQTWTNVLSSPVQGHPLVMSDGTIYFSVGNNGGLVRSVDKGQTWAMTVGSGVLQTSAPVELPDGRIASLGPHTVMVSADCGASWHAASTTLPYSPTGLVYSAYQKAFFVWHFDCTGANNPNDPVPANAVMRFAFDYQTQ